MGQNSIKSLGRSPTQELEVGPRSGPYLLVIIIIVIVIIISMLIIITIILILIPIVIILILIMPYYLHLVHVKALDYLVKLGVELVKEVDDL